MAEQGSFDRQEAVLDAFGAFEDAVAGGGQLESVRRPIEQPGAEALLEVFEPAQHRRVRQPERRSRGPNAAVSRNLQEDAEIIPAHRSIIAPCRCDFSGFRCKTDRLLRTS